MNGYEEQIRFAWLWSLLFGFLYFAVKGAWGYCLLTLVLAVCTAGLSWFVVPFFAHRMMERHYLRGGWVPVG